MPPLVSMALRCACGWCAVVCCSALCQVLLLARRRGARLAFSPSPVPQVPSCQPSGPPRPLIATETEIPPYPSPSIQHTRGPLPKRVDKIKLIYPSSCSCASVAFFRRRVGTGAVAESCSAGAVSCCCCYFFRFLFQLSVFPSPPARRRRRRCSPHPTKLYHYPAWPACLPGQPAIARFPVSCHQPSVLDSVCFFFPFLTPATALWKPDRPRSSNPPPPMSRHLSYISPKPMLAAPLGPLRPAA